MIRMYLTSAGFENNNIAIHFLNSMSIQPNLIKALFIPTAARTKEQKAYIPKCKNDLLNIGICASNIVEYNMDSTLPKDYIANFDVIYICGGDPSYLLKQMKDVCFDQMLETFFLNNGIYIGTSAGSVTMTKGFNDEFHYINCKLLVHMEQGSPTGSFDKDEFRLISLSDNQAVIIEQNKAFVYE